MTFIEQKGYGGERIPLAIGSVEVISDRLVLDSLGRPFHRKEVRVGDESDVDLERKQLYELHGNHGELLLAENPQWEPTRIVEGRVLIDPNNKPANDLYREADVDGVLQPTQMIDWARFFPSAMALEPLQRLEDGGRMLPEGHLTDRTLELFTYMADGIGLRSRARIYAQSLVDLAEQKQGDLEIVSVGCGAAVPNIEASRRIEEAYGTTAHWSLYDLNPTALAFAEELIQEADLGGATFDFGERDEHGKPEGRHALRAYSMPNESVDVVDALGLWEYFGAKNAAKFAKTLYAKVRPGGKMIVSNMLTTRPQLQYNQRAVGWPDLEIRSEEDLLSIMEAANIPTDQVTMTHAEDGVYVVMEINKPGNLRR